MKALVFDGNLIDTLVALVETGPLEDGKLPCRAARETLVEAGLASKIVMDGERGFTAATPEGASIYCNRIVGVELLARAVQTRREKGVIRQLAR